MVLGRGTDYNVVAGGGGLVLPDGGGAYGSRAVFTGFGVENFTLPGDVPTVIGDGSGPIFTLGEGSSIKNFNLEHNGGLGPVVPLIDSPNNINGGTYDPRNIAIASEDKSGITIDRVSIIDPDFDYGIVLVDSLADAGDSFSATFNNVTVSGVSSDGAVIDVTGDESSTTSRGGFGVDVTGSRFNMTGEDGLEVRSTYFDNSSLFIARTKANFNTDDGFVLEQDHGRSSVRLEVISSTANNNGSYGFYIDDVVANSGPATTIFNGATASFNGDSGIYFEEEATYAGGTGDALFMMHNIVAYGNSDYGVYVDREAAYARYGDARLSFWNVSASNNGDDGIQLGREAAYSRYGDATATFSRITASFNGSYGIYIEESGAYAQYGNATVMFHYISASRNSDSGLRIGDHGAYAGVTSTTSSLSINGNAIFIARHIGTVHNGQEGFGIGDSTSGSAAFAHHGAATAMFNNITSNNNGDYGLVIHGYGAFAGGENDNAFFSLTDSQLNGNGLSGFHIVSTAAQANNGGNATTIIDPVQANNNGKFGLYFERYGAYSIDGNATLIMDKVTAYSNVSTGIKFYYAGAKSLTGNARAHLTSITASYNGDYGLYFADEGAYALTGSAFFGLTRGMFNYNSKHGLYVDNEVADAVGGNATAIINGVAAIGNGWGGSVTGSGIYLGSEGASARDGSASMTFTGLTLTGNANHGLIIQNEGAETKGTGW